MAQGMSPSERSELLDFKRGTGPEPATSWGSGSAIPGTRQATVTVLVNEPFAGTGRRYVKYSCGHARLYVPHQAPDVGKTVGCHRCGQKGEEVA